MTNQIDIFPIEYDLTKHPLAAYRLNAPNLDEAGGAFAARVRKMSKLPGIWLRGQNCLVTSAQFTVVMAKDLLNQLHQMALPTLQNTTAIEPITNWQATPAIIAQYIAEGILDLAYDALSETLKAEQVVIGKVQVLRQAQFKGLVVDGISPALQITVRSVMSSNQSLDDYLRQHGSGDRVPTRRYRATSRLTIIYANTGLTKQRQAVLLLNVVPPVEHLMALLEN